MKGSADSASSSKHGWVLPQAKKLFWSADGTTNLPEWKVDFVQAAKGSFGIYAECLVKLAIPAAWVDEFPMITSREWTAMIEPEQHLFGIKLSQYEGVRQGWVLCQPSMCSFLLLNITESSEKRVLEQSNTYWETAKTADDVIEMFKLLCDSHNFYGKAASLVEQTAIRLKHDTFIWISPEDLQHFKLRWEKLIKELSRVGITEVLLPPKNRFLQFVTALKLYGHSTVVQMQCIVRASEVDTNNDYDIPKFYEYLVSLSISQHPVINHRGSTDKRRYRTPSQNNRPTA
jgi:hypothetical protein